MNLNAYPDAFEISFSNWNIIIRKKFFTCLISFHNVVFAWIFLVVFLQKFISWACFVESGLKLIFHQRANLFNTFRSLFRLLAVFSGNLTVENKDVWSVNNLGLHWRLSEKSSMYIRKKSGPIKEPWGTPTLILSQNELWPLG